MAGLKVDQYDEGDIQMILEDYGWDSWFDDQYKSLNMHLKAGRVVGSSEIYKVVCEDGLIDAGISHRLFYSTASDSELPVPGDWVLIISDDSDSGYSIYDLLPRRSFLALPDNENQEEKIPAAANVDYILAAVPSGSDLDPVTVKKLTNISRDWGAEPLFICYGGTEGQEEIESLKKASGNAGMIFIDSVDSSSLAGLNQALTPRKTYAVTGVDAEVVSAIIRSLTDGEIFNNTTTDADVYHNNGDEGVLHVLPSSAILLDIPIPVDHEFSDNTDDTADSGDFDDIIEIAMLCRFKDCRHVNEPGCAILETLDNGDLDYDHYKAFMKELKKESVRVFSTEQSEVKKQKKSAPVKIERSIGE